MKSLVILTDNFGRNFSGGAIATCRTFETVQDEFEEVIVIAQRLGEHAFRNLHWQPYRQIVGALKRIHALKEDDKEYIFYGDFYMTYYYRLLGVPYFFAYHDSWPDQWRLGLQYKIRGLFFIPVYRWVISGARGVITVSLQKERDVKKLNSNTRMIRNGVNCTVHKKRPLLYRNGTFKVIMLGAITDLKFGYALRLFESIHREGFPVVIQIDIFGKKVDPKLAKKLADFEFVRLKGFEDNILFSDYHLMLKTSKMENLSIAVVEALVNHTPVVCYEVGGLPEVVQHGKNGLLVSPEDPKAMYTALLRAFKGLALFDFSGQDLSAFNWVRAGRAVVDFFDDSV